MPKIKMLAFRIFLFLLSASEIWTESRIKRENHHISKRYLLFPGFTILQFTYGVTAPLILPKRSINFSLCAQINYELPSNTSSLFPTVISARNMGNDEDDDDGDDLDRNTFYKYVIAVLESVGLNGESCLLRAICEAADIPMHIEGNESLLENIFHYLLTPSEDYFLANTTQNFNSEGEDKYLKAEILGKSERKCYKQFPECTISLLTVFTKIFQI